MTEHYPRVRLYASGPEGDRLVQRDVRQKLGIHMLIVDGLDDLLLERPKQGLPTTSRCDLSERCTPRSTAEDSEPFEPHAFTPAPRT